MTAEEFWYKRPAGQAPEECLREFAQLHVKAALEAAANNAVATSWNDQDGLHQEVDEQSILSAYPPENIK